MLVDGTLSKLGLGLFPRKEPFKQRPKQGSHPTTRSSKSTGSRTDSATVRTPVNGEPNCEVAQILPMVTKDAEGRRTMAVADDSASASSPGLQGLLVDVDSVILNEASAEGLNKECQQPNPKKDEWDFLLGQ